MATEETVGNVIVTTQRKFADVTETSDDTFYFVEAIVVTESYKAGNNWYRIYSDGWCEQGGLISNVPAEGTASVAFQKPFKDTTFSVSVTNIGSFSGGVTGGCCVTLKRVSDITIANGSAEVQSFSWEAKGFIR